VSGNPKGSKWYGGGSRADRKRPKIEISLSPEAHAKLDALVRANGGGAIRSKLIEELILAAPLP
jgi:hypothetical protein